MEPADTDTALATDFAQIASTLGSGTTVEATLALIVAAAVETIDGCQHAGIFLLEDGEITTVASSDPVVGVIDRLQMDVGEGPCLDAVTGTTPLTVAEDLSADTHYPRFGPKAVSLGVRSGLGLRLAADHRLGALNLYSPLPHAFGHIDRAKAVILAAHCSVALDASQDRVALAESHRHDMQAALASRALIGQAQGILMERERITAEQAFAVLRGASQDLNVKLRDVAQRLVDSGEDPRSSSPSTGAR
jgi:GAF domain-containing protein